MEYLAEKIVNEDLSVRAAEAIAQQLATKTPVKAKPEPRSARLTSTTWRSGSAIALNTRVKIAVGHARAR